MALNHIHLRKLLKVLFMEEKERKSCLLLDIQEETEREAGQNSGGGGDFYAPFWADAKKHVLGEGDLNEMVDTRIKENNRRKNLYPQLREGFLEWWNNYRISTNEPFMLDQSPKEYYLFDDLGATVKVENLLSIKDGVIPKHIYPYFSHPPDLSENAARLGLWLLSSALPKVPANKIWILDIIRGQAFSVDTCPFQGGEEDEFRKRYAAVLDERTNLK